MASVFKSILLCALAIWVSSVPTKARRAMDVAFIIDSSGSLGFTNFRKQINAIINMAEYFKVSPLGTHVATIVYSNVVEVPFTFNDFVTFNQFKRSVITKSRFMHGRSRVDLALEAANDDVFAPRKNTRDYVPKIAILITDGQQGNTRFNGRVPDLRALSQRLRNLGVTLHVIGVGNGVLYSEMVIMAGNRIRVTQLSNFQRLLSESKTIAQKIYKMTDEVFSATRKGKDPCRHPVELGFIVQSSDKLNTLKFNKLKQYISGISIALGIDGVKTRAGLVLYSNNASVKLHFNDAYNQQKFDDFLVDLKKEPGKSRINLAFKTVNSQLFSKHSRSTVSRIAVLFTLDKDTRERGSTSAKMLAAQLKAQEIKLFVVAIGVDHDIGLLGNVVSKPSHLTMIRNLRALNGLVLGLARKICEESVPTAKRLTAVPKSHAEIVVNWVLPWDPENLITGYELIWKLIRDEKGTNIINAPSQSVILLPKQTSKVLNDLSSYSVYNIELIPNLRDGYRGDTSVTQSRTLANINECLKTPCDVNAVCTNTRKSFFCTCNRGFSGNGFSCIDNNECDTNPCHANAECTNIPGSYQCKCESGFSGDGITCSDINECFASPCDPNAECTNTPGSFICECDKGYSGDGTSCTDINECAANPCDTNANCSNNDGSFICKCNIGYSGDGFFCTDIDECQGSPCDPNAGCTNTPGSFICECNKGYTGDGFSCPDINECLAKPCDTNGDCKNNDGSFTCTCNVGYSGNGFICTDIDECQGSPCDPNAGCTNTPGSFICECNKGYTGDGFSCPDINECLAKPCDTNGDCRNNDGSFTCTCNVGYSGNGFICTDIDECITNPCDVNAECTNTPGSFTCRCKKGYTGDGSFCTDNNECSKEPCDGNAKCTNVPGSFKCKCNVGYLGNGFSCTDIDECVANIKPPCDVNAECFNTIGSFYCECNEGFNGNGRVCTVTNICSYPMDLAIAIDTSNSITEEQFETQKTAIVMLARSFGLSKMGTHVSVIVYGSEASVEIKLNDYFELDEFSKAVRNISYGGGNTRIDKALEVAANDVFFSNDARDGMPKMFIIMTDGQQTSAPDATPLTEGVAPLRAFGVKVVTIAIGKEVDPYELIAISESQENIYHVRSFATLFDTIKNVGQSLCQKAKKDCKSHADIALLVDSSASMRGGNYIKQKSLVKAIAREFDVSLHGSHASLVLYNTDSEIVTGFNNKTTLQEFEMIVDKLPLKGGKIRLDKALRLTASDVFTKEKGMRENVPKILFILTDGTQNRKCEEEALELAIAPLRSEGIHAVAVGVGEADARELRPLVKSQSDLFVGQDFDEVTEPVMKFIKGFCKNNDQSCTVGSQFVDISVDGCESETPVEVDVCDGKCSSGTRYLSEAPFFESRCTCCQPSIVSSKDIQLKCSDGTTKLHRLTEANTCECRSCGNIANAPPITHIEKPPPS